MGSVPRIYFFCGTFWTRGISTNLLGAFLLSNRSFYNLGGLLFASVFLFGSKQKTTDFLPILLKNKKEKIKIFSFKPRH
jgi:hypothetical protein